MNKIHVVDCGDIQLLMGQQLCVLSDIDSHVRNKHAVPFVYCVLSLVLFQITHTNLSGQVDLGVSLMFCEYDI